MSVKNKKITTLEFYRKVSENLKRKIETPCIECKSIESINIFGIIKCKNCGLSKGDMYNFNNN